MIIFYSHGGFGNQLFITWRAYFLRSLGRRAFISTVLSKQSFLPTPLSKLDALNHSLHLTSRVVNIISFFGLPILFVVKRLRAFTASERRKLSYSLNPIYSAHLFFCKFEFGYYQDLNEGMHLPYLLNSFRDAFWKNYAVPLSSPHDINSEAESIAIHIRRSDYCSLDSQMLVLPISYYYESYLKALKSCKSPPDVVIYSDDFSHPDVTSIYNLILNEGRCKNVRFDDSSSDMTFARLAASTHLICSNSTFSLWSALLSYRVINLYLPRRWQSDLFADNFIDFNVLPFNVYLT